MSMKEIEPAPDATYRVVKNLEGKYFAQVWGAMYWHEPKWLTIGNAVVDSPSQEGKDEFLTHWLYPDDKFAFDSEDEAKKIIPRYVAAQGKKYGTDLKEVARYQ